MQNTEQILITTGIYFLTGLTLTIYYNYLKPNPIKKWQVDGVPIIPAYPHLNESMDALVVAPKLLRWFAKLDKTQVDVRSITVSDINWFSAKPDPKKLGFVKFNIIALDKSTGKQIASNVVFLRGDSVAILIVVSVRNKRHQQQYVLLCDQMRVASGGRRTEICAGMMDDAGDIASVVLKEVKEETGFDIKNKRDLTELGSIFPSPGACDEEIFLYSWETTISQDDFEEKQRRVFGDATEGEEIKLSFVPMEELELKLMDMKDVKAECAFRRYIASK